ncbi:MAG: septum formation inhibitor Maf [Polyangiales bacterium]
MNRILFSFLVAAACATGCRAAPDRLQAVASSPAAASDLNLPTPESFSERHKSFNTYWYRGVAELTRYTLRQSRYGEVHDGEAVLIFVTEDFLPGPQVKQDRGNSPSAVSVLKLNASRRFYTGIYPYTLMTSSFTTASSESARTLKLSSSMQEWCGNVYSQINRRADGLHVQLHSYFQDEGDQESTLPDAPLEDGLWAQIRIDPSKIPAGVQDMIPALDYIRMRHKGLRAYPAKVSKRAEAQTDLVDHPLSALSVEYAHIGRKLTIYHEPDFPYVIQAWEEHVGPNRTSAVRTQAIMDDYWTHNSVDDAQYREALGLEY